MSGWDSPTGNWDSGPEPEGSGSDDQGYQPGQPTGGHRAIRGGEGILRTGPKRPARLRPGAKLRSVPRATTSSPATVSPLRPAGYGQQPGYGQEPGYGQDSGYGQRSRLRSGSGYGSSPVTASSPVTVRTRLRPAAWLRPGSGYGQQPGYGQDPVTASSPVTVSSPPTASSRSTARSLVTVSSPVTARPAYSQQPGLQPAAWVRPAAWCRSAGPTGAAPCGGLPVPRRAISSGPQSAVGSGPQSSRAIPATTRTRPAGPPRSRLGRTRARRPGLALTTSRDSAAAGPAASRRSARRGTAMGYGQQPAPGRAGLRPDSFSRPGYDHPAAQPGYGQQATTSRLRPAGLRAAGLPPARIRHRPVRRLRRARSADRVRATQGYQAEAYSQQGFERPGYSPNGRRVPAATDRGVSDQAETYRPGQAYSPQGYGPERAERP